MPVNRRSYVGRVVSAKMQNTLVVAVDRVRHHELYGKALRRKTILYVHDPLGESRYGDLVKVIESRPVSKTKRFRLLEVLQRHEVLQPEEVAAAEAAMAEVTQAAGEEAAAAQAVVYAARAAEAEVARAKAEGDAAKATEASNEAPVTEETPAVDAVVEDEPVAETAELEVETEPETLAEETSEEASSENDSETEKEDA